MSLLTDQFLALDADVQPTQVYLAVKEGTTTEQYLLLVRAESATRDARGLKGKSLALQTNARGGLSLPWLVGLFAAYSLGLPQEELNRLERVDRPSRALLQVFFRQADAAVVTSNVLATACELNPQLSRELRVLATSPPVVPVLFFFRETYRTPARAALEPAMLTVHESTEGRQVLTVFQSDRMMLCPLSALDGTRDLLTSSTRGRPHVSSTDARP
jgi:phosphonate transport system substrate-binding protein